MLPLPPDQWAETTFCTAQLGDQRRTKRLVRTAAELSAHTGKSLPASCEGEQSDVEGAYRLLENEAVHPESIAEAGFQATALAAEEIGNEEEDKLCWILLTTESIDTFDDCRTVLRFYGAFAGWLINIRDLVRNSLQIKTGYHRITFLKDQTCQQHLLFVLCSPFLAG